MNKVITIEAFGDNYFYLLDCGAGSAVAIDCGDCSGIIKAVKAHDLQLEAVLITHHHYDHSAGAKKLKKKTGCSVISPDSKRIPGTDRVISGGDALEFANETIRVIATPGHTATSVCYYIEPRDGEPPMLFTGDTMFIGGCGRISECSAETMYKSLTSLAELPEDTLVYPGHDYTDENWRFAKLFDPDTEPPSTPSTISYEKQSNIFLRSDEPEIKEISSKPNASADEVFRELRARKDKF